MGAPLSLTGLSPNDRFAACRGLFEVGAYWGQLGLLNARDELSRAGETVIDPTRAELVLDLRRFVVPEKIAAEIRARYSGRTKAPEATRLFLLALAAEIERASLGRAA